MLIEHLWDESEWRLRAGRSCPTSVSDLTNAVLEEWTKIPINTLLKLVESLHRGVKAIKPTKGLEMTQPILFVNTDRNGKVL